MREDGEIQTQLVHVCQRLSGGGAEAVAVTLACAQARLTGVRVSMVVVDDFQSDSDQKTASELGRNGVGLLCLARQPRQVPFLPMVRLWKYLNDFSNPIIHSHHPMAALLVEGASATKRNFGTHISTRHASSARTFAERRLLRHRIKHEVFVSRIMASVYKWPEQEEHVIPNCYSEEVAYVLANAGIAERNRKAYRSEWQIEGDEVVVVVVGSLRPEKNIPAIIKAFSRVAKREGKMRLLLCGEGPLRKEVEECIRIHGVSSQCHLLGFRTDIPALLCGCDIAVSYSLGESFCVSVVEAAALGLAVVTSPLPVYDEVLEGYQRHVRGAGFTAEACSGAIEEAVKCCKSMNAPERMHPMAVASKYSPEVIARAYSELYLRLASGVSESALP